MTDKPQALRVEIEGDTLQQLAELLPAVATFGAANGEPETSPVDVIALVVAALHVQVFTRAEEILAEKAAADEDKGRELWPTTALHQGA